MLNMISRFSQDIQLVDKQLPSALQTILVRRYRISSFRDGLINNTSRNLQATRADNTPLRDRKMAHGVFTSQHYFNLCHPKGLPSDVKTAPIFGTGVPGRGFLEFLGIGRYQTLDDYDRPSLLS
jgi:hypothetical protein